MQFQIPQFIEIEDKIAGPFSLKQLLYVVGGGMIAFLAFNMLPVLAGAIVAIIAVGGSLALALVKVNGQPLPRIALAAVGFFWKPRLYLWKREISERTIEMPDFAGLETTAKPVVDKAISVEEVLEKDAGQRVEKISTVATKEQSTPVAHKEIASGHMQNYGVAPEVPMRTHLEASERAALIRQRAIERSVAIQKELLDEEAAAGRPKHRDKKADAVVEQQILDQRDTLKKFTAHTPLVNKLSMDLATTKNPIPQREKSIPVAVVEKMSIFRKSSGEQVAAKRVDFR